MGAISAVPDPFDPCFYHFSFVPAIPIPAWFQVSWVWTLPDGSPSYLPDPSYLFLTGGAYAVSVTVTYTDPFSGTTCNAQFNLHLQMAGCEGCARPSFTWIVLDNGSVAFTNTSSNCPLGTVSSYTWSFGDGGTSTATDPTHAFASTGPYNVCLLVECLNSDLERICADTYCEWIGLTPRSMQANEDAQGISLVPNPSSGLFDLLISSTTDHTIDVEIFDGQGRIEQVHHLAVLTGSNRLPLDLSRSAEGIYSVRVTGWEGTRVMRLTKVR